MPRVPWATGNRRLPVAIQGGTAIKISPPGRAFLTSGAVLADDAWTGMVATPTANRAIGDTTLSLNAPLQTNFETGAHSTTNRLDGLYFKHAGSFYRITAQAAAAITFAPALLVAMVADESLIKIQAELPPSCSKLLFQAMGVDILYSLEQDTTAAAGEYFTIASPMSELILDVESGTAPKPLFVVGSGASATGIEVQVYST